MQHDDEADSIEPLKVVYTIKGNNYNLVTSSAYVTDDNLLP
jgi:hypothetical protein